MEKHWWHASKKVVTETLLTFWLALYHIYNCRIYRLILGKGFSFRQYIVFLSTCCVEASILKLRYVHMSIVYSSSVCTHTNTYIHTNMHTQTQVMMLACFISVKRYYCQKMISKFCLTKIFCCLYYVSNISIYLLHNTKRISLDYSAFWIPYSPL